MKRLPLRVLIADDNASMRAAIRRVLRDMSNVEVCAAATDGQQAVQMALAAKPDLLVLDLVMPELTGVEVISVLKKKLPKAKFILFTLYEDKVGKYLTTSAGADLVVEKSKGLSALTQKIETVIAEIAWSTGISTGQGPLIKQIAAELGASEKTNQIHRGQVMLKMKADSVADIVRMAQKLGVASSRPEAA